MASRSRFKLVVLALGGLGFACSFPTSSTTLAEHGFVLDQDTPVRAFEVQLCVRGSAAEHASANARVTATVDGGTLEIDVLDVSSDPVVSYALDFSAVATAPGDVTVGLDARGPWEKLSGRRCGVPMVVQFALPEDADPDAMASVTQWQATFEVAASNGRGCDRTFPLEDDDLEIEISPL